MPLSSISENVIVLREAEVRADFAVLSRRWTESPTFAVVPTNLSLTEEWLRASLALLPEDYKTGHFILMTSGSTGDPKLIIAKKSRAERLVEVIHAAQAIGYGVEERLADKMIERTRTMGAYKPSTLLDFQRGLPIELNALLLEPLRQAKEAGVGVPVLERLCSALQWLNRSES